MISKLLIMNLKQLFTIAPLFTMAIFFSACHSTQQNVHQKSNNEIVEYFSNGVVSGVPTDERINEASGLLASAQNPGHYWTHNDSGQEPELFLIDSLGKTQAYYQLNTALRDWEDISYFNINTQNYLLIGEIGDNRAVHENIALHLVPEPKIGEKLKAIKTIKLSYPDGARDAETLITDPIHQQVFIITKREDRARVYQVPENAFESDDQEKVHPLLFLGELSMSGFVGGDVSRDGRQIILKRYNEIIYWERKGEAALMHCLKTPGLSLPYDIEPQGESIAFSLSGQRYYTLSEDDGDDAPLLVYTKK